jgi:threonyl-tRNA synthetase
LLPVTDDVRPWAEALQTQLAAAGIRATVDRSGDRLGKLIRTGEQQKIPVLAVIGEREAGAGGASLRSRREGDLGLVPAETLIQAAVAANQARAAGLSLKGATEAAAATVSAS